MTNSFILSLIIWLLAVGAILILALHEKGPVELNQEICDRLVCVRLHRLLWLLAYNRNAGGMQFLEDHQWIPVIGARYQLGVDGVAVLLIVLTTLLGAIAALSSWEYIQKREKSITRCCCSCRLRSSVSSLRWTCFCSTCSSKYPSCRCTS